MVILLLFFITFAVPVPVYAKSDNPVKRVLHIDSYHEGYVWSDDIIRAIKEEFDKSGINVELSTEHLDSRRFPEKSHIELFAKTLRDKFRDYKFEIVITSDNAAFDFAIKYRDALFKDIPIVFCGYNFFRAEIIKDIRNITGINEEIDVLGNVEIALKVHPNTRVLVFIISTGDITNKIHANIYETSVLPVLSKRFEVITLKDKSLDEIRVALSPLPKEALVFLFGQTRSMSSGRQYMPEENGRIISSISPVPVYTFWNIHMNTGVLGGNILRGDDQGKKAAEIAIRILKGEKADQIPVIMKTPTSAVFDYKAMERFGIKKVHLPKDSIVINQPLSAWDLYRGYIIFGIAVFVIMLGLILLLLFNIKQRKRAMQLLEVERSNLDLLVEQRTAELKRANASLQMLWLAIEQTPISVIITDKAGNIEYVNPAFSETTGYSQKEVIGQNPRILKSGIHSAQFYADLWNTLTNNKIWSGEICNKKKDGSLFWESSTISPILIDGKIRYFLAIKKDITERKDFERLREDVERIIRHDLKGYLNAIINIPELIMKDHNLTEKQGQDLMLIRNAGQMMLEVIERSLNIYKMETKTYKYNPVRINVYKVVSKVVEMLKTMSQKKGISIKITSSMTSQTWQGIDILVEEGLCVNILQNLLKNAIEASPSQREIVINIESTESSVIVSITNEGTVAEGIREFFFEKYTTSGKSGGTGLGTYSARLMTEAQGGKISLHTDDGYTVTVKLEFPLNIIKAGNL